MAVTRIEALLSAIARRDYLARLARAGWIAFAVAATVFAAGLLATRLTGIAPNLFSWSTLGIPPLAALAGAIVCVRPTGRVAAARMADRSLAGDDLFLTASSISRTPGEYQELVVKQAEERAAKAKADAVVPFAPLQRGGSAAAALAFLALAVWLVPQLDPFGRQEASKRNAARKNQLAEDRKDAKKLIEEIKKQDPDKAVSAAVAEEMAKLQATLDALKPNDKTGNAQKLDEAKADVARRLEQEREHRFEHSLDEQFQGQSLGGNPAAAEAIKKQLEKGEAAEAEKQLDELKSLADQLGRAKDDAERKQIAKKMKEQLDTLAQAAKSQPAGLSQAVQKALDQLAQAGNPDLKDQALQALRDSLDLAQLQMAADAQSARDLKSMQEALQALHMAKELNDKEALDGKAGEGNATMDDYKKMYAEALAKAKGQGQGEGQGQGGPGTDEGQGDGSTRPENDSVTTGFKQEQDQAPLTAGKTLMQWKTHGPAETGKVKEDYLRSVQDVKQGVSEALVHEQVPPGYHDGVKKYFDALDEK